MNTTNSEIIRILLLDDDESFLSLTKIYLKREGQERIKIDTLSDSTKVFDLIKENNYDLLISDYEMPGKNGLEVLEEIRNNPTTSNFPVIIFTGRGREEVAIQALNLGANYYITKGTDIKSQYRELIHVISMIAYQNRIELLLKESEEKYRLIFENENDAILLLDLETKRFYDINPAAEEIYGYTREEFLKLHVNDITVEPEKTSQVLNEVKEGETFLVPSRKNRKKDGTIITVEFKSSVFKYKNKNLLVRIVRDITEKQKIEQQLKESEHKSNVILEALPDLLFQLDKNGMHLSFRGSKKELFVEPESIIGKTVSETLPEDVSEIYMYNIEKTLRSKETSSFEYSLPFKTGVLHYEARMVRNGIDQVLTIVRDITEQTKTKLALIESESRYSNLIDNIPAVSWISDESGKTIFISSNVYQVYGYSDQEIIEGGEELWFGRIHPDDLESVTNHYQLLFENKSEFNIEYRIQRKDGKWIWLHDKSISTEMKGGINFAYGVFIDVTDRKHAEIQNEAMLSAIPDMVFRIDRDTKILSFRGNQESLNLPPDEFLGKTFFDVLPEVVASMLKENVDYLFESESKITKFEYALSLKDQLHYYEARMVTSGDEEILVIVRDITEPIIDKKVLLESKWKFRSLFEQNYIPQVISDYSEIKNHLNSLRKQGVSNLNDYFENNTEEIITCLKKNILIDINQASLELLDLKDKEEYLKAITGKMLNKQLGLSKAFIKIILGIDKNIHEQSILIPYIKKNGEKKLINVTHYVSEEYRENWGWIWIKFIDVTDIEKTKRSLMENELIYKTIFDSAEDAILILDREIIIDCNEAAVKLLGYESKDEIIELSPLDFSPRKQPDDKPSFVKIIEKISATYFGDPQRFNWRYKRKDNGKIFDVEVKLNKIKLKEKELLLSTMRPLDIINSD
ncbi:MAG: Stage 0 sporulation protein A [Candidatus Heimdallarchaeota archaeon LC_3]|nr:MAG: Stage 0 sporulation protein A [Candidatus Heimdallarchaeota archaeon LC_3]